MASSRRRRRISSESVRNMEKLDDSLLIEILRRLPHAKSAVQCRLVCRRWNSLISDPYFITSFVDHRSASRTPTPFVVTATHVPNLFNYKLFPSNSVFQGLDYHSAVSSLKSRPSHPIQNETLMVLATYNDLLLCQYRYNCLDDGAYEIIYYICNPITLHHVALPPCPRLNLSARSARNVVGFLCCGPNFRVMHILHATMLIFSSEEKRWTPHHVVWVDVSTPIALAWNGLLCWVCNDHTIVSCNPYNPDEPFHIIVPPEDLRHLVKKNRFHRQGLGVWRGTLRFWYQWQGLDDIQYLNVWELKDYDRGEWSLKHEVWIGPETKSTASTFCTIQVGFDPDDEDVAYFVYKRSLVSCNMGSRELKKPKKTIVKIDGTVNHPRSWGYFLYKRLLMLVMPVWPTPVPTLAQNAATAASYGYSFMCIIRLIHRIKKS